MIEKFKFSDFDLDWHLEPTRLQAFNLLVGVSGVGKSRVLRALRMVCRAGAGLAALPFDCEWELEVTAGNDRFRWLVKTAPRDQSGADLEVIEESDAMVKVGGRPKSARLVREEIRALDGTIVALRTQESVEFGGKPVPRLKRTESLISIFRSEDALAPLHRALSLVFASSMAEFEVPYWSIRNVPKWRQEIQSLHALREAVHIPLLARFDMLQRVAPQVFEEQVVEPFREIFETVNAVRVGLMQELNLPSDEMEEGPALTVAIDESGVSRPVLLAEASSGMRRTLRHLVELALAPEGSTILIDEYENSLGVNCLPNVTQHLLERTRDLQVIATSHHPYVINNIDRSQWRIVMRSGSRVRVSDASELPELATKSRQEAFVLLMNSSAYREGVAGRG